MTDYQEFLSRKRFISVASGFDVSANDICPLLNEWQKVIVQWAAKRGRASLFLDTGLGKTACQLAWASLVADYIGGRVLILAPLAVAKQTEREAAKFKIAGVQSCRYPADIRDDTRIVVTNYERMHLFDAGLFIGVVLDESSLLKSLDGATRTLLIETFRHHEYKLCCTATPAPNDHMELGNHAEFMGVMSRVEMLSMFFVHDGGDTSKWRLRCHAEKEFWRWMATWAVMIRKPSDIGFSNDGYDLPPLTIHEHIVDTPVVPGRLFQESALTLKELRGVRRSTIPARVEKLRGLVGKKQTWLVWTNLNDESAAATAALEPLGALEVCGSQEADIKEQRLLGFASGDYPIMVSKAEIAGFGLNLQLCNKMAFVGITHSYESFYQAVRRCWRFGQKRPVDVHVIISDRDHAVMQSIKDKQADHEKMAVGMVEAMREFTQREILRSGRTVTEYTPSKTLEIPAWM